MGTVASVARQERRTAGRCCNDEGSHAIEHPPSLTRMNRSWMGRSMRCERQPRVSSAIRKKNLFSGERVEASARPSGGVPSLSPARRREIGSAKCSFCGGRWRVYSQAPVGRLIVVSARLYRENAVVLTNAIFALAGNFPFRFISGVMSALDAWHFSAALLTLFRFITAVRVSKHLGVATHSTWFG